MPDLNAWEKEFIINMANGQDDDEFSPRQAEKINEIWSDLGL
jgi:hypothetical protein